MHDAVPKLVAIAVRMVITICITVFHVSFFILVLMFNLSSLIFHLSSLPPPFSLPLQGGPGRVYSPSSGLVVSGPLVPPPCLPVVTVFSIFLI